MAEEKQEWVLTLDISSKCTGYAFGTGGATTHYGKYIAKDGGPLGARLVRFSKWLSKLINGLPRKPTKVIVEQPYYNRNVRTYGLLSKYVGIAEREVYRILDIETEFMASSFVKSRIGVKKGKNYKDRKRFMVNRINELLGLDLRYHASNKTKSEDDVADAIAILLVHFLEEEDETD